MIDDEDRHEQPDSVDELPVVNLHLWELSGDVILDPDFDLTDPEQPDKYYNRLLWNNDDENPTPICLPTNYKLVIKQIMKRGKYRWMSEPFRRMVLHGQTIHDHTHGDRLHELIDHESIEYAVTNNKKNILDAIGDGVKCNFHSKRCTSVRFNQEFFKLIDDARDEAGIIDKEKWFVYLVVLSLRTHPTYTAYYEEFDILIKDIQRQLDARIARLVQIRG
jgi:hypothetical protein